MSTCRQGFGTEGEGERRWREVTAILLYLAMNPGQEEKKQGGTRFGIAVAMYLFKERCKFYYARKINKLHFLSLLGEDIHLHLV